MIFNDLNQDYDSILDIPFMELAIKVRNDSHHAKLAKISDIDYATFTK